MAAVGAPPVAEIPALPSVPGLSAIVTPNFAEYVETLAEVQEARQRLQEAVSSGRRLAYIACSKLQRSDLEGARASLAAIGELPGLRAAVGEGLWQNRERRLRLCEACNVAGFMEVYIQSLGFLSFLENGDLSPEVPDTWRSEIQDFDNECFLLGLIGTLRELERYAVGRGKFLDLRSVRLCLGVAQSLEEALMQFNFRNSNLRQRFDSVKYSVKKLESLSYEIDLARQRAGMGDSPEADAEPSATPRPAVNLDQLAALKVAYDDFDHQREQVMKRSRDIIKAAKNAIYALQREDWKRANSQLELCTSEANQVYQNFVATSPTLRLGFFSAALEEMAEALSYRAFRTDRELLGLREMQEASGLEFSLLLSEYLGGVMDLTGEVGRLAIRRASQGKEGKETIELCLACVEAVYDGVSELPYLPGSLGKKMSPLKSTMGKIEQVLYELALLSQGVKRQLSLGNAEEDNRGEDGS